VAGILRGNQAGSHCQLLDNSRHIEADKTARLHASGLLMDRNSGPVL